jgi:hypothetical protein
MLTTVLISLLAAPPALTVDSIREEAIALVRVQATLEWYTRTVGETPLRAETYKGHARLFSPEAIAVVAKALKNPKLAPDERRALQFLKSYLAVEAMALTTSKLDDEEQAAELAATVKLSWLPGPTPYKELEPLIKDEKDAARRAEIEKARAAVWKDVLNPVLARKEQVAQQLARQLGYPSYVALSEEQRLVDVKALLAEGHRFLVATDPLYQPLLADVAKKELGIEVAKLRRSDLPSLRNGPRFSKYFPKELMLPAFLHFLSGVGLDMKSAAGPEIRIDDGPHPLKEPRASCHAIHVPDDVRITVKPTGGVDDIATLFHEGGHALHFANATTKTWEFQQLGSNALTEALAELFGKVWTEPSWLRRYRDFVGKYNAEHKTKFPQMTDAEIADLSRVRVFNDFYFLRRYGSAKLIYESVLHGGDPAIWKGSYAGATTDPMAVYQAVFSEAYGFALGEEDALRFRTDLDDTFYAADYARAFALANLMNESLRKEFGDEWFARKEVGAKLKAVFAEGQKLQPDEVAKLFGEEKLTFQASEARARRLLGAK